MNYWILFLLINSSLIKTTNDKKFTIKNNKQSQLNIKSKVLKMKDINFTNTLDLLYKISLNFVFFIYEMLTKIIITIIIAFIIMLVMDFDSVIKIAKDAIGAYPNKNDKKSSVNIINLISNLWGLSERADACNNLFDFIHNELYKILEKYYLKNLNKSEFFVYFSFAIIDYTLNKKYFGRKMNFFCNILVIFLNTFVLWALFQYLDRVVKEQRGTNKGKPSKSSDWLVRTLNHNFTSFQIKCIFISFVSCNIFVRSILTIIYNEKKIIK